jgi:tetratricopeptide (TPR) repeat protein
MIWRNLERWLDHPLLRTITAVVAARMGISQALADPAFDAFLQSTWPEAQQLGVSRATFDAAIKNLEPDFSLADLAIPGRARKEFEKATELVRRQELQEAIKRLNKAIHLYPQYAVAYNNLAVIYGQLGDGVHEKEELQKAISLNPNFALGYVNLGRMEMKANNYLAAEPFLAKAAELDPGDVNSLVLLSYSEFMDKSFDAAIANSRKAHALPQPHAFAHRVAARALEQEKRGADAIAELEAFLKEEPSGPRAASARQEIDVVKTALPN